MIVEQSVTLQAAQQLRHRRRGAQTLVRMRRRGRRAPRRCDDPQLGRAPKFVLGGGSNIVLTRRRQAAGAQGRGARACASSRTAPSAWIVEAGAGENWHDFVALDAGAGLPGPGEPGADPRHGRRLAGAEHRRLRRRAAGPLRVARRHRPASPAAAFTLDAAQMRLRLPRFACSSTRQRRQRFRAGGRALITRVRFRLPKPWKPVLGYLDLRTQDGRDRHRHARARTEIFDWVCAIRRAKLPDPARDRQCRQLLQEPDRHARAVPRHHRAATRRSCTTRCPTAASSWPPAG